jgi:hypothetical protein
MVDNLTLNEFREIINLIVVYLPQIGWKTFQESRFYIYCHNKNYQKTINSFKFLLNCNRNSDELKQLPIIVKELELDLNNTQALYQIFIKTWKPNFSQILPLVHSYLENNTIDFQPHPSLLESVMINTYEPQHSQVRNILSNLHTRKDIWGDWQQLIAVLYGKDYEVNREAIALLDRLLVSSKNTQFSGKVMQLWLEMSMDDPNKNRIDEAFFKSQAWNYIDANSLYKITLEYKQYLPQLLSFCWQYRQNVNSDKFDALISSSLACIQVEKKVDANLWGTLQDFVLLSPKFSETYWLRLVEAWLTIFSNPSVSDTPELKKSKHPLSKEDRERLICLMTNTMAELDMPVKIQKLLTYYHHFDLTRSSSIPILSAVKPNLCTPQLLMQYFSLLKSELENDKIPMPEKIDQLRKYFDFYKTLVNNGGDKNQLDEEVIRLLFTLTERLLPASGKQNLGRGGI